MVFPALVLVPLFVSLSPIVLIKVPSLDPCFWHRTGVLACLLFLSFLLVMIMRLFPNAGLLHSGTFWPLSCQRPLRFFFV